MRAAVDAIVSGGGFASAVAIVTAAPFARRWAIRHGWWM